MAHGLSCPAACGAVIEPVTLSLAGGFLTTRPPGKSRELESPVEAVGTPLEHGRECPIALLNWEPRFSDTLSLKKKKSKDHSSAVPAVVTSYHLPSLSLDFSHL